MSEMIPSNWTQLEREMAEKTRRITEVPVVIREVWNPWECPAGVLPWLAWALHVDDWASARTEEQQRAAIAASIEIHRHKGTAKAVRQALQAVGYDVEIDEATGIPYTFRIVLDISKEGANEADYETAAKVALENKNARSWLLGVRALLVGKVKAFFTGILLSGEKTAILPPLPKLFKSATAFFLAAGHQSVETVTVHPPVETEPRLSAPFYVAGVVNIEMIYG